MWDMLVVFCWSNSDEQKATSAIHHGGTLTVCRWQPTMSLMMTFDDQRCQQRTTTNNDNDQQCWQRRWCQRWWRQPMMTMSTTMMSTTMMSTTMMMTTNVNNNDNVNNNYNVNNNLMMMSTCELSMSTMSTAILTTLVVHIDRCRWPCEWSIGKNVDGDVDNIGLSHWACLLGEVLVMQRLFLLVSSFSVCYLFCCVVHMPRPNPNHVLTRPFLLQGQCGSCGDLPMTLWNPYLSYAGTVLSLSQAEEWWIGHAIVPHVWQQEGLIWWQRSS